MAAIRAWLRAIDPPIYVVGLFPPLVGAAATLAAPAPLPWLSWALVTGAFLCIHGAVNVYNDAFDASTPADRFKSHSLARLATPGSLFGVATALLVAGCLVGVLLWLRVGGWTVFGLSAAGVGLVFAYHAPPFRLSHRGWGEVVTFAGFGLLPVWTTSALADGDLPSSAIVPGALAGWAAALLLFQHNAASVPSDEAGAKRTLAVLLGSNAAPRVALVLWTGLIVGVAAWEVSNGSGRPLVLSLGWLAAAVLVGPIGLSTPRWRCLAGYSGTMMSMLVRLVTM